MTPSLAHQAAREAAGRLSALQASLSLLTAGPQAALQLLNAADTVCATVPLASPPAVLDDALLTLTLNASTEGMMAEEGPLVAARMQDGLGQEWAILTVSAIGDGGDLQFAELNPPRGTFVRLVSAVVQG
jgi:hypothetical protein